MSRLSVVGFKDVFKPELIEALEQSKIVTSLQFVRTSSDKLARLLSISLREVLTLKKQVISAFNVKPIKGHKLYKQALRHKSIHKTGIAAVDTFIGGGLLAGSITEMYGAPCSGKTKFAIQSVAKSSVSTTRQLLYLSTSAFHLETLHNLLRQMTSVEDDIQLALQRVHVVHLKDVHQLLDILHSPKIGHYSFIVVDSLAMLFLRIPSGNSNYRISLLAKTGSLLKRIAKTYQTVILVINHVSSGPTSFPPKPTLGRYWQHVPTLRFLIEKKDDSTYRLTIHKNAYGPSGASLEFRFKPLPAESKS